MEQCTEAMAGRRKKAFALDGLKSYIYDRRLLWHDTCVEAWRKRGGLQPESDDIAVKDSFDGYAIY